LKKQLISCLVLLYLLSCAPSARFSSAPDVVPASNRRVESAPNFVVISPEKILATVERFKGAPYVWGGESINGVDCSGLVRVVFFECEKIKLPHSSNDQADYGVKVAEANLQCGDIVFFRIESRAIDHVGIYLGNQTFVHASPNTGVTVSRMDEEYYSKRYAFARRLFYE